MIWRHSQRCGRSVTQISCIYIKLSHRGRGAHKSNWGHGTMGLELTPAIFDPNCSWSHDFPWARKHAVTWLWITHVQSILTLGSAQAPEHQWECNGIHVDSLVFIFLEHYSVMMLSFLPEDVPPSCWKWKLGTMGQGMKTGLKCNPCLLIWRLFLHNVWTGSSQISAEVSGSSHATLLVHVRLGSGGNSLISTSRLV